MITVKEHASHITASLMLKNFIRIALVNHDIISYGSLSNTHKYKKLYMLGQDISHLSVKLVI